MVDVQQYYFPMKFFGNENKKRAPLSDISNQPAPKKHKELRDDTGRGTTVSDNILSPFALPATSTPNCNIKEDFLIIPSQELLVSTGESDPKPLPLSRGSSFSSPCPLDRLPVETLLFILSFLPTNKEKLNARLVSSYWDKLLRDKAVRKAVHDEDDILRVTEMDHRVTTDYVVPHFQKEVTPTMRTILIDWLIEVTDEFAFHMETFFLCVNYLDRYLSVQQVPKSKLQLVGIVCLFIAAYHLWRLSFHRSHLSVYSVTDIRKYEETIVPRVDELVFLSDNTCTREEIFAMEVHILAKLQYCLVAVTSHSFLAKFLTTIHTPNKELVALLSYFFIKLAALNYGMIKYPASLMAASALCLALHTCKHSAWTYTLEYLTHYSIADKEMQRCVADLHTLFENAPWEDRAVYKKFQACFGHQFHPSPPTSLPRLSSPKFLLSLS